MRYFSQGTPTIGAGAFLPVPARNPRAYAQATSVILGGPRVEVESPKPAALIGDSASATSQGSNVSPEVIQPSLYIATCRHQGPRVPTRPDEVMPLPAINPGRVPRIAFTAPQIGGFYIRQPATTPWWTQGPVSSGS